MDALQELVLLEVERLASIGYANNIGCILNTGHGKIPAPDFNFYIQKDKYPI